MASCVLSVMQRGGDEAEEGGWASRRARWGSDGAPAVKKPSGSGYSVRGEQGDKERRGSLPAMKLLSLQL